MRRHSLRPRSPERRTNHPPVNPGLNQGAEGRCGRTLGARGMDRDSRRNDRSQGISLSQPLVPLPPRDPSNREAEGGRTCPQPEPSPYRPCQSGNRHAPRSDPIRSEPRRCTSSTPDSRNTLASVNALATIDAMIANLRGIIAETETALTLAGRLQFATKPGLQKSFESPLQQSFPPRNGCRNPRSPSPRASQWCAVQDRS